MKKKEYIAYAEDPIWGFNYHIVYESIHRANSRANLDDAARQFQKKNKYSVSFTYSRLTHW